MTNRFVERIATVEIPVSNVKNSIEWYGSMLGMTCVGDYGNTAMLHLRGGTGVPTVYLVETTDTKSPSFTNTSNGVIHSVIDFYTSDLEGFRSFLMENDVEVGPLNIGPEGYGGFGFQDLDGNWFSVCNVVHEGQE